MGMKKHALAVVRAELTKQMDIFLTMPSATNFLVVNACKLAYQLAFTSSEQEISGYLANTTSDKIVFVLAKKQEDMIDEINTRGRVVELRGR